MYTCANMSSAAGTITQAIIQNPNTILANAIKGQNITQTIVFKVSTGPQQGTTAIGGGGIANIDFLGGDDKSDGPNADVPLMTATYWIETVVDPVTKKPFTQIQYSQTVILDFAGLSWPHVSVSTLVPDTD